MDATGHELCLILDELESVYEPVHFNHSKHALMSTMSGGCENCHHFIPPSSGHPACKECHSPDPTRNGTAQPGLKAAYHRQCLGCHTDWDTEASCEFCHAKKGVVYSPTELARIHGQHSGEPMEIKELIVFRTEYDEGDQVPFHHRNHVEKYNEDCSVCHTDQSCANCHVHGTASHPLGMLGDIDLHETCYQCHDEGKGCDQCHGRSITDLFDHATTGWMLKPFHEVLFCTDCHSVRGKYEAYDPRCESCHPDGWNEEHFNHGITGVVLDDVHGEFACEDCHTIGVGSPSQCGDCHDDNRKYTKRASFGTGVGMGQ